VPGGGTALLRAEEALENLELEGDYATGADLVRRVLSEPLYWIATNAGYDGRAAIDEVRSMAPRRRPERAHRRVRRPARGRRDRPGPRDAADDRERGVGRGAAADDRGRSWPSSCSPQPGAIIAPGFGDLAEGLARPELACVSIAACSGRTRRARSTRTRGWSPTTTASARCGRGVLVVNFVHGLREAAAREQAERLRAVLRESVALARLPRSGRAAVPRLRRRRASST
jgi:hypothetical protein